MKKAPALPVGLKSPPFFSLEKMNTRPVPTTLAVAPARRRFGRRQLQIPPNPLQSTTDFVRC